MWQCQQTGDCCRQVGEVVMTHAERYEIERVAPHNAVLSWHPHDDSRFVRLRAKPCPLLVGHTCSVYAVRPYNCRRWGCFRDDYSQPPELVAIPAKALETRSNRRQLVMMQRKGQKWARKHGWVDES